VVEYFNKIRGRFLNQSSKECEEVLGYLGKFREICAVELDDLKGVTFRGYVEGLVRGK